jgi:AraC-like DNA-binding protein
MWEFYNSVGILCNGLRIHRGIFVSMRCFIKYMVCDRCKVLVINALKKVCIDYIKVNLGELIIEDCIPQEQLEQLRKLLKKSGLELLDNLQNKHVEVLLNTIEDMVNFPDKKIKKSNQDYLSEKFHIKYASLNTMFSEIECVSIEKYIDELKVTRIKEMLTYNELNINEIAKIMHFSNVAHLSSHFKSHTGLTPAFFRQPRSGRPCFPCCN